MKIGIDPGHGGRDPGAVGPTRVCEKDVTLAISLELDRLLRAAGLETYMTRTDDRTMELITRTAQLNNMKCDLAVSVHINSATRQEANYISTFIQAQGGEAEKLARKVQNELVQAIGWPDGGVRVKNLHMTRETKMPAILCECGFISNPEQEQQLRQSEVQKKLAGAIVDGVLDYLGLEGQPMAEPWKEQIMKDAAKAGLIDGNHGHKPDESSTKWFVLAVCLNLLEAVKGGK